MTTPANQSQDLACQDLPCLHFFEDLACQDLQCPHFFEDLPSLP
jgi:hypothetical protein